MVVVVVGGELLLLVVVVVMKVEGLGSQDENMVSRADIAAKYSNAQDYEEDFM